MGYSVDDRSMTSWHAVRLQKLALFRTAVMDPKVHGHPVDAWDRLNLESVTLGRTIRGSASLSGNTEVSYSIPLMVKNHYRDGDVCWTHTPCANCQGAHRAICCKEPRWADLLCCVCLSGCHKESDCKGSLNHPVGEAYWMARAAASIARATVADNDRYGAKGGKGGRP